jgi:hypothetical protein
VGFDEDSAYLGRFGKALVDRALAVPGEVRRLPAEAFIRATVLLLLAEPELRLISVWSPTFLTRLMAYFQSRREELCRELADGVRACGRRLRRRVPADPWPRLGLISCWTDAHAATQLPALRRWFPRTEIQPKGLIATEAFVSLPFAGRRPFAVTSHYFELETGDGSLLSLDRLKEGDEGVVVVSTGAGLIRYRLGDRIAVDGFLHRTPCIRFLGRRDKVCDLCGEKLSEDFVASVLARLRLHGFSMLAPDGDGYTLYAERPPDPAALERLLADNVHYRWAVRAGQLRPARTFRVERGAEEVYLRVCRQRGQRLGDIKPVALDDRDGWSGHFRAAS